MHLSTFTTLLSISGLALALPSSKGTTPSNANLITQLKTAATAVDRLALLDNNPANFKYDFKHPPGGITSGKGGHTVRADSKLFPALIGTGVGMTVGFLGPCGFNTPHTHPRSSEINIITQGTLTTNFIAENGAPLIVNTLDEYQMTVFPQGALHTGTFHREPL
jgi:hypothetical protein